MHYHPSIQQGYREDAGLYLESDTDEQLLVHIPFNQAVRISGIIIKSTAVPDQAPKLIKLFTNRPTIGFNEAESDPGIQSIEITEDQLKGNVIPLKVVKFSRVNCLSVFVESNQGDEDTTRIEKISLLGSEGDTMDVSSIKDISKEKD